jgi:hypothetical protein
MEKKNGLTKILAIVGTVLVWFPIIAPILFSVVSLIADGRFRFDYLMPAELFMFFFVGGGLLVLAALRARLHLKLIAWAVGIAVFMLFAGQGLAMVTGLASGANEAEGWRFALVLGSIILFDLAIIVTGVGGILLWRDLFKRPIPSTTAS